ncbi:PepSY-associated TM helix domain-containing protein [soil metagenome]
MKTAPAQQSRSFWLKQLHQWHWISAALSLVGMLCFAVTGFTLNHAGQIEAAPKVVDLKATLPADLLAQLAKGPVDGKRPLPITVESWLDKAVDADIARRPGEWSRQEVYLALARPGGDAWISIDRETGAVEHEKTTRGAISLLNDLHKGRNAGKAWGWFIDIFAGACVVFAVTGLILLQFHARARPLTWPLVAGGLVIPLLLVILFVHL